MVFIWVHIYSLESWNVLHFLKCQQNWKHIFIFKHFREGLIQMDEIGVQDKQKVTFWFVLNSVIIFD